MGAGRARGLGVVLGMGVAMSNKDLLRTSHAIRDDKDAWWYEEEKGICLVVSDPSKDRNTFQFTIPWRSLRAALKRKDKP